MENKFLKTLKYLLGWPLTIVSFIFIYKLIAPQASTILINLSNLNFLLLAYGILSLLMFYFMRSVIWHTLLKKHTKNISFRRSAYFLAVSELKRYIPGNIWGFLGRTMLFSDETKINKKTLGKLLLVEALSFVVGSGIFALLSLPFVVSNFLPQFSPDLFPLIWLLGAVLAVLYIYNHKLLPIFSQFTSRDNTLLLLHNLTAAFFFGLGHYLVISSFVLLNPQLAFQLSGFFVLAWLIGYLSVLTPAGFGVREGIMIGGLSKLMSSASSAFAALFSRIILIVVELIFLLITYGFYKTKNKNVIWIENWIASHKHEAILIFIILIYTIYISTASFLRFDNFYAGKFDLGNMTQTVWNTIQGRIFTITNPDGINSISRLGVHADFILILLAPFYALWPNPKNLLLIQTIIVALGSFFVYRVSYEKLKNKNISLAFGLSYLINPSIQRANLYDFHGVTLATTFLLGAYYFYVKSKYKYFVLFAFLAAITKEQVWVIIGLFGVFIFFKEKKRIVGILLTSGCFAIFYLLVAVAIPAALGSSHFALSNYSEFGDSPVKIIQSMITSPAKLMSHVLQPAKIDYLNQLLSPVGYLPLIYPLLLIFTLPDLAINLLSLNPQFHQIYYQYTAVISPFLFLASIYGVSLIKKLFPKIPLFLFTSYIVTVAIIGAYRYGPLPGAKSANLDMFTKQSTDGPFIRNYLAQIPPDLSVAASNNIGAHLSHRERLYILPTGLEEAEVVAFFLNETESKASIEEEKRQLTEIKKNANYELIVEKGEFVVFKKKGL